MYELKSLVSSMNQQYLNQKHHIHNSVPLTIIHQLFQCILFKFEEIHKVINIQRDGKDETVEKHTKEKAQCDTPNKVIKSMEGMLLFARSAILCPKGFLNLLNRQAFTKIKGTFIFSYFFVVPQKGFRKAFIKSY